MRKLSKSEMKYPVSGCGITMLKGETLFDGLSEEEIKEVWKYSAPEKLPDGTVFYSLRNAVTRFKLAKQAKEKKAKKKNSE